MKKGAQRSDLLHQVATSDAWPPLPACLTQIANPTLCKTNQPQYPRAPANAPPRHMFEPVRLLEFFGI